MTRLKSTMETKIKLFNEYVLSVRNYGSEAWALNATTRETLAVAQYKMKRIKLGITLRGFDKRLE